MSTKLEYLQLNIGTNVRKILNVYIMSEECRIALEFLDNTRIKLLLKIKKELCFEIGWDVILYNLTANPFIVLL